MCEYCDKEFETAGALGGHVGGHIRRKEIKSTSSSRLFCKHCDKTFDDAFQRHNHEKHDHRPWDDIIKNSSRRHRLIRENGHQCPRCKLTEWMGEPIPLELDHIDGDRENNSRENCRLLCANCHSQTPTFRGRNAKLNRLKRESGELKNIE